MGGFGEWEFSNGNNAGLEWMDAAGCSTCVPDHAMRDEAGQSGAEEGDAASMSTDT